MPKISWSSRLATGQEEIDTQHRRLIEIINAFLDAMEAGAAEERIALCLDELCDYTRKHFGDEEALMGRVNFPYRAQHMREHERLVEQVEGLHARLAESTPSVHDLHVFLKVWLIDHILGWDFNLSQHIRETSG